MSDPATAMMITSAVTKAVGSVQQQSQGRAQAKAQQVAINRQIEQQNMERAVREKQQRDQSKRQQASARASFGARGVSSTNRSASALLDGIDARTEEAIADNGRLADFGIETLRQNQQVRRRHSLLEQRNSIMNTVVNTAGKKLPSFFETPSNSGAFGTGTHPGER